MKSPTLRIVIRAKATGVLLDFAVRMISGSILVVDDDQALREVMHDHLSSLGYRVTVAEDGPTALKLLNTMTPDLILLDVSMPGMDGVEVLRRVTARLPHIPVVMVTAFNDNKTEVDDLKDRYTKGQVGDVEVKKKLAAALNRFLTPIRDRRQKIESHPEKVEEILRDGSAKAQKEARETLRLTREAMKLKF